MSYALRRGENYDKRKMISRHIDLQSLGQCTLLEIEATSDNGRKLLNFIDNARWRSLFRDGLWAFVFFGDGTIEFYMKMGKRLKISWMKSETKEGEEENVVFERYETKKWQKKVKNDLCSSSRNCKNDRPTKIAAGCRSLDPKG